MALSVNLLTNVCQAYRFGYSVAVINFFMSFLSISSYIDLSIDWDGTCLLSKYGVLLSFNF